MLSEIGSGFWINPQKEYSSVDGLSPHVFGIFGSDFSWLSTGRSAISLAIECAQVDKKYACCRALLPAYTCESVIEPFLKKGFSVEFFSLNEKLEADFEEIKNIIYEANPDVFLFHRYFGFDTAKGIDQLVEYCHERGIIVIEDRTQCLYSDIPLSGADYYVGSIRKWCEAPDGGFVVCQKGTIKGKPVEEDRELEQAKLTASYGKYDFLFNGKGDKSAFLKKYAEAEEMLERQDKIYCAGKFSLAVQSTLNVREMKTKRRENYEVMFKGLKCVNDVKTVFDSFAQEVTPLYLPVFVKDRKSIQLKLRENSVYAPVIWPKAEIIKINNCSTEYLYQHMLCIPIDQRYGADDMQRIIYCLSEEKK